ncbi:response regulator [Sphaerisporangium rubeum]|uniref:CheY-like chemotaxis protein n=1 Tax=Sphaerisporangium rubeum TaxID=321317 RepID=A0A7X0M6I6_9ACTN|nr:response regulator [Sphaerisporangium rubeum]MBB6473510.1 CheY-like chemotaxis protein [Sphaerisporangium rubeum]
MIVDDNDHFLTVAGRVLDRGEVRVVGVSRGPDAMERFLELDPDVALVDVELGDGDGFELAERLCRAVRHRAPCVILISARDGRDVADLVEESSAVAFVAKADLSVETILAVVRATGCHSAV